MEKCGILRSYIDKIIGWQSRGSEGERSYSNYTIKQIAEQLERLQYNCLKQEFKEWKKIMAKNKGIQILCGKNWPGRCNLCFHARTFINNDG